MKRFIVLPAFLPVIMVVVLTMAASIRASDRGQQPATGWQSPSEELLQVLHAPQLPWTWIAPTGDYMLLADPMLYPPLVELAAPMHKLAGMRVNPAINGRHGRHGGSGHHRADSRCGQRTSTSRTWRSSWPTWWHISPPGQGQRWSHNIA